VPSEDPVFCAVEAHPVVVEITSDAMPIPRAFILPHAGMQAFADFSVVNGHQELPRFGHGRYTEVRGAWPAQSRESMGPFGTTSSRAFSGLRSSQSELRRYRLRFAGAASVSRANAGPVADWMSNGSQRARAPFAASQPRRRSGRGESLRSLSGNRPRRPHCGRLAGRVPTARCVKYPGLRLVRAEELCAHRHRGLAVAPSKFSVVSR